MKVAEMILSSVAVTVYCVLCSHLTDTACLTFATAEARGLGKTEGAEMPQEAKTVALTVIEAVEVAEGPERGEKAKTHKPTRNEDGAAFMEWKLLAPEWLSWVYRSISAETLVRGLKFLGNECYLTKDSMCFSAGGVALFLDRIPENAPRGSEMTSAPEIMACWARLLETGRFARLLRNVERQAGEFANGVIGVESAPKTVNLFLMWNRNASATLHAG